MLRDWQQECLNTAKQHYFEVNKHFLCLATPAAGKTILAAEVAASLFETNQIDFVLCFSPSITVAEGIKNTFSRRLNCNFDGVMGAIGCSYTYQNMRFFNEDNWKIIKNNRVLVVFDEIHHCSGSTIEEANAWGQDIVQNIQEQATFTLALTGTPWRSDLIPIALANYSDLNNEIQCDYTYSLQQAVNDGVCRSPKIVLIDNEEISVTTQEQETKVFNSLHALLKAPLISYQDLICHDVVIRYILKKGCNKLAEIRQFNSDAGGLIVASSVEHAHKILIMLTEELEQTAVIVTYKEPDAADKIKYFRFSSTQWIVSVGMVSEGTDIPRLQVCCHLSRVKTELYFRQVLGRILRVSNSPNQDAYLFTLAEENLSLFASRLDKELPDTCVLIRSNAIANNFANIVANKKSSTTSNHLKPELTIELEDNLPFSDNLIGTQFNNGKSFSSASLEAFGGFREKLIEAFSSI